MRRLVGAGIIGAMFLGLVGLAIGQDTPPGEATATTHTFTGKVVKSYKGQKLLHMKVEYVPDEQAEAARAAGIVPGNLVYVQVPIESTVVNQKGKTLKREADDDDGWDAIKDKDARLEVQTIGTNEVKFKGDDKDEKGMIRAYLAKRIQVIKED